MTSADPVRTPPESVEALTLEQPTRSVQQYFAVLGAGTVGLIICVALLMWTSDVTNGPRMEQIWVLIRTMFIAGTVAWLLNPVLLGKARIIQFTPMGWCCRRKLLRAVRWPCSTRTYARSRSTTSAS